MGVPLSGKMIRNKINTVEYSVTDLVFAEYNPRELTQDQHQDLKDSITRFGFVDPLIVNTHKERKNILVGGHQRLRIAKELGYKDVPCVEVNLTPTKEKELNVRLNKNTGQWDWDALANHFDVGELLEWGFSEEELQFTEPEEVQGLTDDDDVPEVEEAITQQGDLWILGEHRVLCGDATIKADVDALMGGQKADMVFTDPPYGVEYDGTHLSSGTYFGEGQREKLKNDDVDMYKETIPIISNILKADKSCAYIFYAGAKGKYIYDAVDKSDMKIRALIIWNKNHAQFGSMGSQYKQKHEPILYLYKKTTDWYGANNEITVWDIDRASRNEYHPTQKPIELALRVIENHHPEVVVDIFLGSGSTLIACEKTNRKCYGMEIDPHYCDVIVKRWEDYTGNKAERFEAANA